MKEQILILAVFGVISIIVCMSARIVQLKKEIAFLESVLFENKEKI